MKSVCTVALLVLSGCAPFYTPINVPFSCTVSLPFSRWMFPSKPSGIPISELLGGEIR